MAGQTLEQQLFGTPLAVAVGLVSVALFGGTDTWLAVELALSLAGGFLSFIVPANTADAVFGDNAEETQLVTRLLGLLLLGGAVTSMAVRADKTETSHRALFLARGFGLLLALVCLLVGQGGKVEELGEHGSMVVGTLMGWLGATAVNLMRPSPAGVSAKGEADSDKVLSSNFFIAFTLSGFCLTKPEDVANLMGLVNNTDTTLRGVKLVGAMLATSAFLSLFAQWANERVKVFTLLGRAIEYAGAFGLLMFEHPSSLGVALSFFALINVLSGLASCLPKA
eukprot:comp15324_c0_seq1/m.12173 comp15324_c0_seq1/g.12173  ORF comp15324_c0_seq1/g.12173 comp15324_c0_seq1/m.12173 type:complete len:281 (-) comp15324_c0_seq1:117-959(-)